MRNKFLKLALYVNRFGFFRGTALIFSFFFSRKGKIISIHVPGIAHPVYLRAKSSDEYTFRQIFVDMEYEFDTDIKPATILDAGANIGLAAIYFANRFPGSQIICLEPESNNFEVLKKNIQAYPQIKAIRAGLWSKSTYLRIRDEGLGHWGFIVEECNASENGSLQAFSVIDILKEQNLQRADFIKMDIEGSEKEVLEAEDLHQWLSHCKVLVIELHDRMKKGTSAALFKALLSYDTEVEQKGENMICRFR